MSNLGMISGGHQLGYAWLYVAPWVTIVAVVADRMAQTIATTSKAKGKTVESFRYYQFKFR